MSTRSWITILGGFTLLVGSTHCTSSGGTYEDGSSSSSGGSSSGQPAAACDSAKCSPGNTCIESDGVTECRLTCDAQRGPTGCPDNYTCVVENDVAFCKGDRYPAPVGPGQWGAFCNSLEGPNASQCDAANAFVCQYSNRNDPAAFCTAYCEDDGDCTGGYYCGTANDVPSGSRQQRTIGATHKICLPRDYCAPCTHDLDCGLSNDGTKQFCAQDANGAGYCTKPCQKDSNCNDEARCNGAAPDGTKLCKPIAGVCVGDGGLCSPCRSDADCAKDGACVQSRYSTERTCTVPSKVKCDITGDTAVFDCPKDMPKGAASKSFVSCVGQVFSEVPKDQCSGLVPLGTSQDDGVQVGCYARKR